MLVVVLLRSRDRGNIAQKFVRLDDVIFATGLTACRFFCAFVCLIDF